jgi:ADP-ribosylglycohydrolase
LDHSTRLERVRLALDGLSVGDAFGERFFTVSSLDLALMMSAGALPKPPWQYTDDTVMALGILAVLEQHGRIEQDALASAFAHNFGRDPFRGYGATAYDILGAINRGVPWRTAASEVFRGAGSLGNGGAMRVAPVGAYFADDLPRVVAEARASAEVTHMHPEGQAGAIAVAVAAAWASQVQGRSEKTDDGELLEVALAFTPNGETRAGLVRALALPDEATVADAVAELGNGRSVTAPETVPFALWCASRHLHDYEAALWTTLSGAGDIDTNCAIVGGIVALAAGRESIPAAWLEARERLTF